MLASKLLGKNDAPLATKDSTGDARQDAGGARQDAGDARQDAGDARQDAGDARQDAGDARQDAPGMTTPTTTAVALSEQATSGRHTTDDNRRSAGAGAVGGKVTCGGETVQGGEAGGGVAGARVTEEAVRIVAVDLQEMAPIDGVKQLQVSRHSGGCSTATVDQVQHPACCSHVASSLQSSPWSQQRLP